MAITYEPIATTTLTSATQYVNFTSIPQTYTDLVLVHYAKDSGTGTVNTNCQVGNGSYDTATNYSYLYMGANGTTNGAGYAANISSFLTGAISTTSFTPIITNFMNYSNTTTYKTIISRCSGGDFSSGQTVSEWVCLWRSTSAINQLRVYPGGQTWAIGSIFTLFGIKAA